MKRYLVLTLRRPQFDPALVAPHHAHLDRLRAAGALELHGPFGDRSGGAYVLRAESLAHARALAFADPLHTSGASEVSVREWKTLSAGVFGPLSRGAAGNRRTTAGSASAPAG